MKIVLDAMGGDHAPEETVKGAIEAINELGIKVILVGSEEILKKELKKYDYDEKTIEIVAAEEVIEMGEHPGTAIRKKKKSSIVIGTKLVKEGNGEAFVSAGNTGAVMASSLFGYGRISGIDRPAIGSVMPTLKGISLIVDAGANADCKPQQLVQFAIMGQIYAERILGIDKPRIGLLNIGEEEAKGNELSVEAHKLLKKEKNLKNFIGNIEGRDITEGKADVVVCDGFVGNVVLKFAEGLAKGMFSMIKHQMTSNLRSKMGAALVKPSLTDLKKKLDYSEYGGAPLLGTKHITIISHGSSDAKAIKNALRVAKECIEFRVIGAISDSIETSDTGDEA